MFVFHALAHFDTQNDGLLRFGKEDDCMFVCSNSPKSKLLECKRAVFSPLNSHNFLFVFIVWAVINRVGCKTSEICISTDKEEQSQLRVHFTKPLRPSSLIGHLTNFGLASKQLRFGVICHSFVIANLLKCSLTTVKTALPSENKIYQSLRNRGPHLRTLLYEHIMVWIFISIRILDFCGLHCVRSGEIWFICVRISSSFWISQFNSTHSIE